MAKIPLLTSYAYLRDYDEAHIADMLSDARCEVLLDSGAFTAFNSGKEISLTDYMAFVHRWGHLLFGYMALDKLQDPVTTDANLKIMLSEGLKPIPIHVYGDDHARMDWLFEQSAWVACGGLRRPHRGAAPDEYVKEKMRWAGGRNVHWLGYTVLSMIKGFKPYSCDCASWTAGRTFGQLHVYMGGGLFEQFVADGWAKAGRKVRGAVAKLGFDPATFDNKDSWRNQQYINLVQQLNARSWVVYTMNIRKHIGTRLFLAMLPDLQDIRAMRGAIDWADAGGLLAFQAERP